MESTVFFEKKVSITPKELNRVKTEPIDDILLQKAIQMIENKCSEQGFVLPGSVSLLSRSVGYFEAARFTGDSNYYVKLQARVLYPVDGVHLYGEVIRKNKMGLYVNYNNAIHVQVPRDLHIGDEEFDKVEIGQYVLVELKRSKFAINDAFILSSGKYISKNKEQDKESDVDEVDEVDEKGEKEEKEVEIEESKYDIDADTVADETLYVAPAVSVAPVEKEIASSAKPKSARPVMKKKTVESVVPVAPVEPVAPVAPVAPVEPVAPVAPVAPVEVDEKEEKPVAFNPVASVASVASVAPVTPNSPIRAKAAKPAGAPESPESPKNKTREQQEKDDASLALQLQEGGKVKKRATKTKQKDAV